MGTTLIVDGYCKECIQYFTTKYDVNCMFLVDSLFQMEEVLFCSYFAEKLDHEWLLSFDRCFFCVYWDDLIIGVC